MDRNVDDDTGEAPVPDSFLASPLSDGDHVDTPSRTRLLRREDASLTGNDKASESAAAETATATGAETTQSPQTLSSSGLSLITSIVEALGDQDTRKDTVHSNLTSLARKHSADSISPKTSAPVKWDPKDPRFKLPGVPAGARRKGLSRCRSEDARSPTHHEGEQIARSYDQRRAMSRQRPTTPAIESAGQTRPSRRSATEALDVDRAPHGPSDDLDDGVQSLESEEDHDVDDEGPSRLADVAV